MDHHPRHPRHRLLALDVEPGCVVETAGCCGVPPPQDAVCEIAPACRYLHHVLLGLFSREVVPPVVSSTAGGFVKMIAQIGGASAGYPLGRLQQYLGWEGVFASLGLIALAAAAAAAPLWRTMASIRIGGRNGTVQDFKAMQRKGSSEKDLYRRIHHKKAL